VRPDSCASFVSVGHGRDVHCSKAAGHGPADDIHHGLLRVTLPDGREHAASLVWSTSPCERDEDNLRRSD
jgi:hypothetical protein